MKIPWYLVPGTWYQYRQTDSIIIIAFSGTNDVKRCAIDTGTKRKMQALTTMLNYDHDDLQVAVILLD